MTPTARYDGAPATAPVLLVLEGARDAVEVPKKKRDNARRDWTHPSLNVWVNKTSPWVRQVLHDQFVAKVRAAARDAGTPWIRGGRVRVTVTYFFRGMRRRDFDNYTPKFILDGLVAAGVLEDDSQREVASVTTEIERDDDRPRTEIRLEVEGPRVVQTATGPAMIGRPVIVSEFVDVFAELPASELDLVPPPPGPLRVSPAPTYRERTPRGLRSRSTRT